jgi:hypothetical protein
MGLFDSAAGSKAKHGGNAKTSYFDHVTDAGESVFILRSMPIKVTQKKKANIVPVTLTCLLTDSEAGLKAGDERTYLYDMSIPGQSGSIRAQEFKSLVTALARIPLADEQAREAVERLVEITGEDHGLKSLDKASTQALIGARDSLIGTLMERWTEGEGEAGAGTLVLINIWGRPGKDANADKLYTQIRFKPLDEAQLADLTAAAEAGHIAEALAQQAGLAA